MEKLHDTVFGNSFSEIISKTQETNDKINKLNFININFCVSKDTVNRVTRQHREWEKIFANHISDKRLTARVYKELL